MIRAFRAEWVKLRRRRVIVPTMLVTAVFSFGVAALVLVAASDAPGAVGRTTESLSRPGGGTEVFTTGAAFVGTFLFVLFAGAVAVEFTRGTMRTMLLRQPHRVPLLAGKLAALLTFAAVVIGVAEVLTWNAALLLAPWQGVSTAAWTSLAGLGHAVADFGTALFWVTGYAVFGTTLAVLTRSVPVALAVGIAWAGPFEHILQDGWAPAGRLFPGLLLEAFVAGGRADVTAERAFVTVALYLVIAAAVTATTLRRRDVAG